MIADVAQAANLNACSRALEIGPGTGQATRMLEPLVGYILAVESGANMAAFLRKNFPQAKLDIVVSKFENLKAPAQSFDLIYAAQSFHWIEPQTGLQKCAELLKPAGSLALFWNNKRELPEPLAQSLREIYDLHFPEEQDKKVGIKGVMNQNPALELEQSGLFCQVERKEYPWEEEYKTGKYLKLLDTYSDHIILPKESRAALFSDISALLNTNAGRIRIPYLTELYLARK